MYSKATCINLNSAKTQNLSLTQSETDYLRYGIVHLAKKSI